MLIPPLLKLVMVATTALPGEILMTMKEPAKLKVNLAATCCSEVQRAKETLILPSFRQHGQNSGVRDRACG